MAVCLDDFQCTPATIAMAGSKVRLTPSRLFTSFPAVLQLTPQARIGSILEPNSGPAIARSQRSHYCRALNVVLS